MKYLKKFSNHSDYNTFTGSTEFIKPNVSHCIQENDVHYNPKEDEPVEDYKWKVTFEDGTVVTYPIDDNPNTIEESELKNYLNSKGYVEDIRKVEVYSGITSINDCAFNYVDRANTYIFHSITPPLVPFFNCGSIGDSGLVDGLSYVPSESLNAYKTAGGWSEIADRIFPIE